MKNEKLLKYFTEQILPVLDEIEFTNTEHEEYIKAQETLNQVLNKYKIKFNSLNADVVSGEINTNLVSDINVMLLEPSRKVDITQKLDFPVAA
ncbi:hypothetical protein ACPTKN_14195 [Enterococcus faecalis]|uniref:hypothetical protein n=1 Tax=Enterococcus faecalis TaxID=1351 RepID=UPI003CC5776E